MAAPSALSSHGDLVSAESTLPPGHGDCVRFVRTFKLPTLVLGGGGYTIKNVARCWTYETSVLLGTTISNELPMNDHLEWFGPKFQLHPDITLRMDNLNSRSYLDNVRNRTLESIRALRGAPSVQMQEIPPELLLGSLTGEDDVDVDVDTRDPSRAVDARVDPDNEYYDDDNDNDESDLDV